MWNGKYQYNILDSTNFSSFSQALKKLKKKRTSLPQAQKKKPHKQTTPSQRELQAAENLS